MPATGISSWPLAVGVIRPPVNKPPLLAVEPEQPLRPKAEMSSNDNPVKSKFFLEVNMMYIASVVCVFKPLLYFWFLNVTIVEILP